MTREGTHEVLPPVVCVVGWKGTGKTTLTVALVSELVRRGRRVATAKHGHGFELDTPGTDSWRHRHEAGAGRVALVGPEGMAVMGGWGAAGEPPLREVVRRYLPDAELVVAEGWKEGPEPKIEVHRDGAGRDPILSGRPANASSWLAVVSDGALADLPVPVVRLGRGDASSLEEVARTLADVVEERLLRGA